MKNEWFQTTKERRWLPAGRHYLKIRVCVCVCCRHFATSQLVNYANWSLGTCFGARMKYCLRTLSHDWLHMLGENTQEIRPVEGKMSERSTSSRRKAEVFLRMTKMLAAEAESRHMEPFHMNQHGWKRRRSGRSWRSCSRQHQHCLWMFQQCQCQCSFAETRLGWWKKTAYVEDVLLWSEA